MYTPVHHDRKCDQKRQNQPCHKSPTLSTNHDTFALSFTPVAGDGGPPEGSIASLRRPLQAAQPGSRDPGSQASLRVPPRSHRLLPVASGCTHGLLHRRCVWLYAALSDTRYSLSVSLSLSLSLSLYVQDISLTRLTSFWWNCWSSLHLWQNRVPLQLRHSRPTCQTCLVRCLESGATPSPASCWSMATLLSAHSTSEWVYKGMQEFTVYSPVMFMVYIRVSSSKFANVGCTSTICYSLHVVLLPPPS